MIEQPELERPPRGGSDLWEDGAASTVYIGEFFADPPATSLGAIIFTAGALSADATPAGGDLKVYLNTGLLYAKTAPAGGDLLVSLYDNGLFQAA